MTERTIISDDRRFEWDVDKDQQNFIKHGIRFNEVIRVFDDPYFMSDYDLEHSGDEDRYVGLGLIVGKTEKLLVVVSFTNRRLRTRLISARSAGKLEERIYLEFIKKIIR